MIFRKPPVDKVREKAAERLSRLDRSQVLDWADVCAAEVWRCLEDYRKQPDPIHLDEMETGLRSLLGVVDTLRQRASTV